MSNIGKKLTGLLLLSFFGITAALPVAAQVPPPFVLVKTGTPNHFAHGDTLTYQMIAFNNSGASQAGFSIVDTLPQGFILNSYTGPAAVFPFPPITGPGPVNFGPFTIGDGESVTFTLS